MLVDSSSSSSDYEMDKMDDFLDLGRSDSDDARGSSSSSSAVQRNPGAAAAEAGKGKGKGEVTLLYGLRNKARRPRVWREGVGTGPSLSSNLKCTGDDEDGGLVDGWIWGGWVVRVCMVWYGMIWCVM